MSAPAIACVVVAAAMLYDHGELLLDLSYEAGLEVQTTACGYDVPEPAPDAAYMEAYALLANWEDEARCGGLDSDACLRDRLRAQLEAFEAGRSYDEVIANSPTGVAFVAPTRVR